MIDSQDRRVVPSAIERLSAPGPFAPDIHQLMLYGRLIGEWDIDWVVFDRSGKAVGRRRGEWHFAWVLGGRGVQDVIWAAGAPPEEDGTTLRCWDAKLGAWRVVFMSPHDGEFVTLVGRPQGDRIVQEVIDRPPDARAERWTFSEISDAEFLWQAERSSDGGATWTVTHQIRARRAIAACASGG
jgi:hypothetical protein